MNRRTRTITDLEIGALLPAHWPEVGRIYAEGIATGDATFETTPPSWDTWDAAHLATPRLIAVMDGETVGWAALSPISTRCVYGGVAEVSVYVRADQRGRGVGTLLLEHLIRASEECGVWTLQAGVFPENTASIAIHKNAGFVEVGRRERIGKLGDRWRDVLLLERRSKVVGVD